MYSRYYPQKKEEPIRLPDHYDGCAFERIREEKREPIRYFEVAKPSPVAENNKSEPTEEECAPSVTLPPPPPPEQTPPEEHPSDAPPPLSPISHALRTLFPFPKRGIQSIFSKGLDFDELLLLSLILLLLESDGNTELILCLSLLLFCG